MRLTVFGLLLGAVGLAACNNNDNGNFVPTINNVLVGTFALRTVNGHIVPTAILDSAFSPDTVVVESGAMRINADNTFADVVSFQETLNDVAFVRTVLCNGTYTRVGTVFTFVEILRVPDCDRTFTGVVTGNVLQSFVRGVPAVFSTQP